MKELTVSINPAALSVSIAQPTVGVGFGATIARDYSEVETYDGPYEITPTQETQVLETQNKRATANITVGPIPSNYGKITWDGSVLTVS